MPNNHIITRHVGDLRGFSTDSLYLRPANVATTALNLQKAPDGTLQIRRGYQCQISNTGGMGISTYDDPVVDKVKTVCLGLDGNLYEKQEKQIYFYYNGTLTGAITGPGISNGSPAIVHSVGHGLITGTQVILRGINGMLSPGGASLNFFTYTITVIDPDNFSLDGTNTIGWGAWISGGTWSIAFADQRYLTLSIFTDPRYITSISNQSITCDIIINRAAQINGAQPPGNTFTVQFGHTIPPGAEIQFYSTDGIFQQRQVIGTTPTSITFNGTPVGIANGSYINQLFDIVFGKGFDVALPYPISTFITTITTPITGVYGLKVAVNGDTNLPAAFIQILESTIIPSNTEYTLNYWYWKKVNATINPPLPGSANIAYQNSPDFENASMTTYDDVVYIANGWDYPQKYDGQTIYRTGMPEGNRPVITEDSPNTPFLQNQVYQYGITYEQIDNRDHIVEGEISEITEHTIVAATAADIVTVKNLSSTLQNNWNTNGAIALGDAITPTTVYGPDVNGFYYDYVAVSPGYTLKIGDSAYYADQHCAQINGAQTNVFTIKVDAGHGVLPGDLIYFVDNGSVLRSRTVENVDTTEIEIEGAPVTVADNIYILDYKVSKVFGNVAIVNGNQNNVNTINVVVGYTIQINDIVEFIDSSNNLQRRKVTGVGAGTITIDGIPVSILDKVLIASTNQVAGFINLQRTNSGAAYFVNNSPISNNLRINIYRTKNGEKFGETGEIYLVASIPNKFTGGTQNYLDQIIDAELNREFDDPDQAPNPPPISKYVKGFGNQIFYAGGERGNPENSDRVFFSDGNAPETVPLATNFFNVPNLDDDITGIGIAGSTLITTKNHSIWAATGNFLSGEIEVVQIDPGTNIGCIAHASIATVGSLMYFLHTNGVYAVTENQLYPTDPFGNAIPITLAIDQIFRETNYLPYTQYVLKRATAINYTKDNQYLLFLPCEDSQSTIRTANLNSILLCYDYQGKNWFKWDNMNAAGGMIVIEDDLYFQERRFSAISGNTANLYKQHRFYRLIDHADHAGPQRCEWLSSWEDLGQPEVRKKFCRCVLLMDRVSDLLQVNNPIMTFSSYLNRLPGLQNTIATITTANNIRNAGWSISGWGWNYWGGYQDSFITVNLKQGTVAKSIAVGFTLTGINMDIRLAGFQLETIPENRKTIVR